MYTWQPDFNMKNVVLFFLLLCTPKIFGQFVGTPVISTTTFQTPLDLITDVPSFAFSTRKLKSSYTGFVLRVRKSTDNSEVDISFDSRNRISNESTVRYAVAGTSGIAIGTTTTLTSYKGAAQLFASIWYDQSGNARNAVQSNASNQPELLLSSQNSQAILLFDGTKNIPVSATASQLLGSTAGGVAGIVGTFLMTVKITGSGVQTLAFGFADAAGVRFMSHLNWSDGNLYFDAGEICCATQTSRFFNNATNVNLWKQYTFQRQDLTKIIRISGTEKINGNGNMATSPSITYFGIGSVNNGLTTGFVGQISEAVLFNKSLSNTQMSLIENNQMANWSCY